MLADDMYKDNGHESDLLDNKQVALNSGGDDLQCLTVTKWSALVRGAPQTQGELC